MTEWPQVFCFTIYGEAISWRAPHVGVVKGRHVAFSNKVMKAWQEAIRSQLAPHAPPEPLRGPIQAAINFYVSMPTSWPEWRQKAFAGHPCVQKKRRDPGNLAKLLLDVLEGVFYIDDGQVFQPYVTKYWTHLPHATLVSLTCWPEQPTRKCDVAAWNAWPKMRLCGTPFGTDTHEENEG